ncbi:MAG: hypothetical protein ACJ74O_02810 [Frankiaceae bacterium]
MIRLLTTALVTCVAVRLVAWLVWPLLPWLIGVLVVAVMLRLALGARRL